MYATMTTDTLIDFKQRVQMYRVIGSTSFLTEKKKSTQVM